jgi:hypothetical protein
LKFSESTVFRLRGAIYIYINVIRQAIARELGLTGIGRKRRRLPKAAKPLTSQDSHRAVSRGLRSFYGHSET